MDNEIFIIKIKVSVMFPDVSMSEITSRCPTEIKREARSYLNSGIFRTQITQDINKVVDTRPKFMDLNLNTIYYDDKLCEVRIYGIVNLTRPNYENIPTYTEFNELLKKSILEGLKDGYPISLYKKYLGPREQDYRITFNKDDIIIRWY